MQDGFRPATGGRLQLEHRSVRSGSAALLSDAGEIARRVEGELASGKGFFAPTAEGVENLLGSGAAG
jgi:hypothetical protein